MANYPGYEAWLKYVGDSQNAVLMVVCIAGIGLLWLMYARWMFPRIMPLLRRVVSFVPGLSLVIILAGKAFQLW